jgi:glycerophosphoryl diester phosphodiesterase
MPTVPATNWMDRRVVAYAHQGGAWEWPSSTLFAMRQGLAAGASALELDVHSTADGELVVCHDATVDRTTNGSGSISSLTYDELRRLDNAYWFIPGADVTPGREAEEYPYRGRAPEDRDFGVATLREILEQFPGVVLNLDIKQGAPAVAPYEAALARLLADYDRVDDVIVTSFFDPVTDAFRTVAPQVATSAGTLMTAEFWRSVHAGEQPQPVPAVAFQVPERYGDILLVDDKFVAAAHGLGVAVHVWTVDDVASMERLLDLDVDGIITDVPTQLVEILDRRGVRWPGLHPLAS